MRIQDTAHLVCQMSIYNSFPVIRTTIAKNRHFYVPRPSFFVCPVDAPAAITQNAWIKRQFSACQTPRSMCPSISNSLPVIRTTISKNRHFTPLFFVCPGYPLQQSRKTLHEWKDNSVLAKPLAACTHLSTTVSQLFDPQLQKSQFWRIAAHIFVSPGDAPAVITQYVAWMER